MRRFGLLKKNHSDLIRDYYKVKSEIFSNLRKNGFTVSEDDTNMYMGKAPHRFGSSHHLGSFYLLKKELEKKVYQIMLSELHRAEK